MTSLLHRLVAATPTDASPLTLPTPWSRWNLIGLLVEAMT
jgi:hypothetical protein